VPFPRHHSAYSRVLGGRGGKLAGSVVGEAGRNGGNGTTATPVHVSLAEGENEHHARRIKSAPASGRRTHTATGELIVSRNSRLTPEQLRYSYITDSDSSDDGWTGQASLQALSVDDPVLASPETNGGKSVAAGLGLVADVLGSIGAGGGGADQAQLTPPRRRLGLESVSSSSSLLSPEQMDKLRIEQGLRGRAGEPDGGGRGLWHRARSSAAGGEENEVETETDGGPPQSPLSEDPDSSRDSWAHDAGTLV
jgi:hypothetical protein